MGILNLICSHLFYIIKVGETNKTVFFENNCCVKKLKFCLWQRFLQHPYFQEQMRFELFSRKQLLRIKGSKKDRVNSIFFKTVANVVQGRRN